VRPIQEVQIALRPSHERGQEDPPAIRRRRYAEDVLLRPALAEDEVVLRRILAETVETDPAVVVLVTGGYRSRCGMDRVVEAAVHPRDRASLGVRDPVRQHATGRGLDDRERGHLVTAARKAVRNVASVRRGVIPVERHETRGV